MSGWVKEMHNSDNRNDAAGLAIDEEGNLYFSLGCMSYNKAWLLGRRWQVALRHEERTGIGTKGFSGS